MAVETVFLNKGETEAGVQFAQTEMRYGDFTLVTSAFGGPFHPKLPEMVLDCAVLRQDEPHTPDILAGAVNTTIVQALDVYTDSRNIKIGGVQKRIRTLNWALGEIENQDSVTIEKQLKTARHSLRILFLALLFGEIKPDSRHLGDIADAISLYGSVMKDDREQHPAIGYTEEYLNLKEKVA